MAREIFTPFHAESFGGGAHDEWYRDVIRTGSHHDGASADDWWLDNVRVGGGYYSYGMRYPETQAEVDEAYRAYWALAADLFRDMREDERERPAHPGRMLTKREEALEE